MKANLFPLRLWTPVAPPFKRILVAKTSHLGDLVISLPMAAAIKKKDPDCTVIFLTSPATADVARCCPDIDEVYGEPETAEDLVALLVSLKIDIFIQVNNSRRNAQAADEAGIPIRIGSLYRLHNIFRCTHLVATSRSFSGLNKRLLDLQYLLPLGIEVDELSDVLDLYHLLPPTPDRDYSKRHPRQFAQERYSIILSPALRTAQGHQWPQAFYSQLIRSLNPGKFHWFICGVASDRQELQELLVRHGRDFNVTDLVGQLSLTEFISFISNCDGLIAGSTGPLHLAAALGIHVLGLFQSRRMDIQRWQPLGRAAAILHSDVRCKGARHTVTVNETAPCPCIVAINPDSVARCVRAWFEKA